ncbi:MAG: 1-acyl-sn-glycerol-3-phosphate acyltransferase [Spirochaetaceae bacterium]|nr:1-acyl-sn-glycerol-3-phosphate acyltransferase [Spirochaetaceae bacterium]
MAYKIGSPLINRNKLFLAASKILIWFAAPFLAFVMKLLYHYKVKGRPNLKLAGIMPSAASHWKTKPCILVSNHVLPLDPVLQGLALFPRTTYFTLLEDTVLTPGLGTLVQLLGGVPIPRSPKYLPKMDEAVTQVVQGPGLIHFYPEGECFLLNQEIKDFRAGAFYYAIRNQVPIVPIATVLNRRSNAPPIPALPTPPPRRSDIVTVRIRIVIMPPIQPPAASGSKITDLHHALEFAQAVHDSMQAVIDAEGGDRSLYQGPMPRIKGVNDKSR